MNRFIITVFLALFSFHVSIGQTDIIDSLKVVILNSPDDTIKVQSLISLVRNLNDTQNENAIYYASRARDLAITLDYHSGLANALKHMGSAYFYQSEFVQALSSWEEALAIYREIGDKLQEADILSNLGNLNCLVGDDIVGEEYYSQALAIVEETGDNFRMAILLFNMAEEYGEKEATYGKSREFYARALPLFEQMGFPRAPSQMNYGIAESFFLQEKYDSALIYYERSMVGIDTIFVPTIMNNLGRIYAIKGQYEKALANQQQALEVARSSSFKKSGGIGHKQSEPEVLIGLAETYQLQGLHRQALAMYQEAIPLIQGDADLTHKRQELYQGLALSYGEVADYDNAFKYQKLMTAFNDSINSRSSRMEIEITKKNFMSAKKLLEIDILRKDKTLEAELILKQKIVKNAVVFGFLLFVTILSISHLYFSVKKKNKIIADSKKKSDDLLLNILPEETAKELMISGHVNPQKYALSTVLFTDFKEFTEIVDTISPDRVVRSLDYYFGEFDRICANHNLEKIKTIGDAYMCVGGIPTPNDKNPIDVLNAAVEMLKFVLMPAPEGIEKFEIRIGIHTGPIIAGIVGIKKFQYDVWGSAVNIASLMEANSEPQKINISQNTYEYVKYDFNCTHRGQIEVKHGRKMDMYFVDVGE